MNSITFSGAKNYYIPHSKHHAFWVNKGEDERYEKGIKYHKSISGCVLSIFGKASREIIRIDKPDGTARYKIVYLNKKSLKNWRTTHQSDPSNFFHTITKNEKKLINDLLDLNSIAKIDCRSISKSQRKIDQFNKIDKDIQLKVIKDKDKDGERLMLKVRKFDDVAMQAILDSKIDLSVVLPDADSVDKLEAFLSQAGGQVKVLATSTRKQKCDLNCRQLNRLIMYCPNLKILQLSTQDDSLKNLIIPNSLERLRFFDEHLNHYGKLPVNNRPKILRYVYVCPINVYP